MGKKLNTFVTVHDDEGAAHTFGPQDKLPGWAKKAITNPNVWADGADDQDDDGSQGASGASDAGVSETGAESPTGSESAGSLAVPPLTGAGSSTDAWRAYAVAATKAAGLQLDIPADAKRGDIVEALKSAGIATE